MRVGIIGCGKIAQIRHIPEYLEHEDAEICAYYDMNVARAEELAAQYGGVAYASVEELLAQRDIDAVSVCVANNAHAAITIQALEAGKHVLCEKPMATTMEDCISMVEAADKAKRKLMIGQNQRYAKAHVRAKELLQAGIIGKVLTFQTTFGHKGPETWSVDTGPNSWFFDKNKASLGAMADLGIHKTDLIRYLLGEDITEATAKIVTLDKRDSSGNLIAVDDNAICIYQTVSGAIGTMTASWCYYGPEDNSTILYGTDGIMKIYSDPNYSIVIEHKEGETIKFDIDQIQTNDNQTKSGVIDAFVHSVIMDEEPPVSGKAVLNSMQAVFAAVQSGKTGKTVKV